MLLGSQPRLHIEGDPDGKMVVLLPQTSVFRLVCTRHRKDLVSWDTIPIAVRLGRDEQGKPDYFGHDRSQPAYDFDFSSFECPIVADPKQNDECSHTWRVMLEDVT
jgi:hypothetical protein